MRLDCRRAAFGLILALCSGAAGCGGDPVIRTNETFTCRQWLDCYFLEGHPSCVDGSCQVSKSFFRPTPWEPAFPQRYETIEALSGQSAGFLAAAGWDGLVLSFDGAQWNAASIPGWEDEMYRAVWASPSGIVWASGSLKRVTRYNPVTNRFNELELDDSADIYGLWGTSDDDVWALALAGQVYHWDGVTFGALGSVSPVVMEDISGSGPQDVWAVGWSGTVMHRTTGDFEALAPATSRDLTAVHARAPDDVWIAGESGTVLHYDGIQLTLLPSAGDVDLLCVFALGPRDVWVGGDQGTASHWDGTAWRHDPLASSNETVAGIWGTNGGTLWAASSFGTIYRHTGMTQ